MRIDFDNFRINLINNFNQVVENTDFSAICDADLYDWHDLRNSVAGLGAIISDKYPKGLFDAIHLADIPNVEEER